MHAAKNGELSLRLASTVDQNEVRRNSKNQSINKSHIIMLTYYTSIVRFRYISPSRHTRRSYHLSRARESGTLTISLTSVESSTRKNQLLNLLVFFFHTEADKGTFFERKGWWQNRNQYYFRTFSMMRLFNVWNNWFHNFRRDFKSATVYIGITYLSKVIHVLAYISNLRNKLLNRNLIHALMKPRRVRLVNPPPRFLFS